MQTELLEIAKDSHAWGTENLDAASSSLFFVDCENSPATGGDALMLAPEDQDIELRRKLTDVNIHNVPHRTIRPENIHGLLTVGCGFSATHAPMATGKGPPVFANKASRT